MSHEESHPPPPAATQETVPAPREPPLAPEWADLLNRLSTRYPLRKRTENWMCLEFPEGQTIQVNCLKIHGLYRVILSADLCNADLVSARDARVLAAKPLLGGLGWRRVILSSRPGYAGCRTRLGRS